MKLRLKQKEETKARILEAAYTLFAERGLLETNTQDIALAAKVSHGTLFLHFPTRNHLIQSVIDAFGAKLAEAFGSLESKQQTLREVLRAHLDVIAQFEPFYTQLVIVEPLIDKEIRNSLLVLRSGIACFFDRAYKSDLKEGRVVQVALPLLLNSWLGLIHYYLTHRDLFAPNDSVVTRWGDKLLNHFLSQIYNKE